MSWPQVTHHQRRRRRRWWYLIIPGSHSSLTRDWSEHMPAVIRNIYHLCWISHWSVFTPMIIYRMAIVEGRCDKLQLLISYLYNHWLTQKYGSDWSDTMVWFGQILLYLSFTILYIWSLGRHMYQICQWEIEELAYFLCVTQYVIVLKQIIKCANKLTVE